MDYSDVGSFIAIFTRRESIHSVKGLNFAAIFLNTSF